VRTIATILLGLSLIAQPQTGHPDPIRATNQDSQIQHSPEPAGKQGFSYGFAHEIRVTQPGSRSEGRQGVLTFQGRAITGLPGRIRTPIGTFFHIESDQLWNPQGWFPTEDLAITTGTQPFTPADRTDGSYRGPWRPGTPGEWCYLPHLDSWIDPRRLTGP
jgi:hypothetical protein